MRDTVIGGGVVACVDARNTAGTRQQKIKFIEGNGLKVDGNKLPDDFNTEILRR